MDVIYQNESALLTSAQDKRRVWGGSPVANHLLRSAKINFLKLEMQLSNVVGDLPILAEESAEFHCQSLSKTDPIRGLKSRS